MEKEVIVLLTGVYQIGKYLSSIKDASKNPLEDIIEDASDGGKYKHILKIIFRSKNKSLSYEGIEYEEYSNSRKLRYAYKSGPSKGGDYTPISKYVDSRKTLERIEWSIKKILTNDEDVDEIKSEKQIFKSVSDLIAEHKKEIIENINEKKSEIKTGKNEYFLLCLVIETEGELKYPGDFLLVQKRLLNVDSEQYYSKYNKISKGEGTCYYCSSQTEVFGFVNTFNSYTVDKKGMIAGGFKQENAWISYPVCATCAKLLELGKKYVLENMSSRFSNFDYMVIPKLSFYDREDWSDLKETIEDFEKKTKLSTSKDKMNNLLSSEKEFLEIMKDSKNSVNYNILIYREEQSGNVFRILLYIEDIVPSRVKRILYIKKEVDENKLFHVLPGKDGSHYNLVFTFSMLRKFFPNNKIEGDFDKNYLEILNNIFSAKEFSYKFLLNKIVDKLRRSFAKDENIDIFALEGLMLTEYIKKLELFNDYQKGGVNIMPEISDKNKMYMDFLKENCESLDSDVKKAVFLTGVLVKKLLYIQYRERNSQPFYSRLNGLKLSLAYVRKLFVEAVNKLNEYDKNYYSSLEELIGEFMLTAQTLSDDETSFYFTLGMTLARKFKVDKEEEKNDKEQA